MPYNYCHQVFRERCDLIHNLLTNGIVRTAKVKWSMRTTHIVVFLFKSVVVHSQFSLEHSGWCLLSVRREMITLNCDFTFTVRSSTLLHPVLKVNQERMVHNHWIILLNLNLKTNCFIFWMSARFIIFPLAVIEWIPDPNYFGGLCLSGAVGFLLMQYTHREWSKKKWESCVCLVSSGAAVAQEEEQNVL